MEEKRSSGVWIVAAAILLLPALYVGGYLAMLDPDAIAVELDPDDPQNEVFCQYPCYRFGDQQWVDLVFYPAWRIDKPLRPERWET